MTTEAVGEQWQAVHGIGTASPNVGLINGHRREAWLDFAGRAIIEKYLINGMSHGTPLDAIGTDTIGVAGPYMLDVGISSTRQIARYWGLEERTIGDNASSKTLCDRPD